MKQVFHRPFPAILTAILLCLLPLKAGAQQVAVKTNVLSWAALTPDLGVEVVTGEHTSVALSVFGHYLPFKDGRPSQLAVLQPEFRYWFNGRPLTREYLGISAFWAYYDSPYYTRLLLKDQVFSGNALALGVSGGYVFSLGARWGLELSGGTGLLVFRQKHYWEGDQYDAYYGGQQTATNSKGYKIFPVKLAVTFIYIIR